jgi:hypothetical protein
MKSDRVTEADLSFGAQISTRMMMYVSSFLRDTDAKPIYHILMQFNGSA